VVDTATFVVALPLLHPLAYAHAKIIATNITQRSPPRMNSPLKPHWPASPHPVTKIPAALFPEEQSLFYTSRLDAIGTPHGRPVDPSS
jgi:hypothetical protein